MAIQENDRTFEALAAHGEELRPTLTVDVQRADRTVLLLLAGELDALSAPLLLSKADEALTDEPCERLILSCDELTFVDSSGLRALIGVRAACAGTDTRVHLVKTSAFFEQLLAVTGLEPLFD